MKRCGGKWSFVFFLVVLSVAVFLATTAGFAQTPKRGGWLKVATDDTAMGLDPHLSITNSTFTFEERRQIPQWSGNDG
ncbi:MAG: hypothetical protein NTY86_05915 [Deltaproteobacteria bacterium]|nr:hypothetical protein [Deltaproteobacteria bacterium]